MNNYKKKDANGNEIAEQIGKGFNEAHYKKVQEARKKQFTHTFKVSKMLEKDYRDCGGTDGMLRAFMQGFVIQTKKLK